MAATKAKVLIVDDDDLSPVYLAKFLGDRFDFDYAPNGNAALAALKQSTPAVILMDVEMPGGMNGYQTCRAIKDDKATQNIPVFFISAHSMAEDRLKAYESGGDDYVSKPFNVDELKYKIGLALAHQDKRNELAEKARQATNMALLSIREAANAGAVLGFLSDIVRLNNLEEIIETTLRTLQKFHIEGAVQLRLGSERISRNSAGECTAVEDAVLTKMASDSRIVDLGKRSAFNYERASIIVYDMPVHDAELYGRLKDTVVKMAEALDVQMGAREHSAALQRALMLNAGRAHDIGARVAMQRGAQLAAMKKLAEAVAHAGDALPDAQKTTLQQLAREILAQAQGASDHSDDLSQSMQALSQALQAAVPAGSAAATAADAGNAASHRNSVELF